MQWHTHVQFGLSSLWLWQLAPTPIVAEHLPLIIGCTALGSLLPDLDAAESKIKHLSLGRIKPFYLPARAIHQQWGHRGFTHSLLGLAAATLLSLTLIHPVGWESCAALVAGYSSHLAADACTKSGIPALYPSRRRYHLLPPRLRLVTGSQAEEVVFCLLSFTVLLFLLQHLPLPG
jgi:membrane-bound metal-dependent hydrolase YbcI (DUF457 family)